MKNYCVITTLAACLLLTACDKTPDFGVTHSIDLTWTPCGGTKAEDNEEKTSWLVLEHTPAGLGVTITNTMMNCAINALGLTIDVNVEGNVINYDIHQRPLADCICLIEQISSTVEGLIEGNEYILNYNIDFGVALKPIRFKYQSGLKKYVNVQENIDESRYVL